VEPPEPDSPATDEPREREIVIRIRRRRAGPAWRLASVVGWATTSLAGDPILLLIPPFVLTGFMLLAFALGAPGRASVLLPLVSLPPIDAFQDLVIIDLGLRGTVATWLLRAAALLIRAAAVAVLMRLAVQRARGELPSLSDAVAFVKRRYPTFAFLELVTFGGFGATLSLGADLTSTRDDAAIGTALLFGVLVLIGMFVAAASGEVPAGAAVKAGLRRLARHPLGHLGLVLLYGFTSNGLYRLVSLGEPGRQRALPLTLYAFASALLTMWFLLAFARRQILLDAEART
jgi:hypothetical protein